MVRPNDLREICQLNRSYSGSEKHSGKFCSPPNCFCLLRLWLAINLFYNFQLLEQDEKIIRKLQMQWKLIHADQQVTTYWEI